MLPLEHPSLRNPNIKFIDAQTLAAALPVPTLSAVNPWMLTAHLLHRGHRRVVSVVPDAVFALEFGEPQSRAYFYVEADRATMPVTRDDLSQSSFRRKLLGYLAAHRTRQHIDRLCFPNLRVLTLTTSVVRTMSLLDAVRDVAGESGMFLFCPKITLSAHENPLDAPWFTAAGMVSLATSPRKTAKQ